MERPRSGAADPPRIAAGRVVAVVLMPLTFPVTNQAPMRRFQPAHRITPHSFPLMPHWFRTPACANRASSSNESCRVCHARLDLAVRTTPRPTGLGDGRLRGPERLHRDSESPDEGTSPRPVLTRNETLRARSFTVPRRSPVKGTSNRSELERRRDVRRTSHRSRTRPADICNLHFKEGHPSREAIPTGTWPGGESCDSRRATRFASFSSHLTMPLAKVRGSESDDSGTRCRTEDDDARRRAPHRATSGGHLVNGNASGSRSSFHRRVTLREPVTRPN